MKKNNDRIKILYTIPNFDTAGSGIALMKMIENLDKNRFVPKIACLHGHGDLFKEVIKMNIEVYFIDLYKNPRPLLRMFKECYNLARVFKKINPHIIHSYNYSSDYTEPLAARIAGIKWVYTKKNMSWYGPSQNSWRLRSYLAEAIVCQNLEMKVNFFSNFTNIQLIPIGVDTSSFTDKNPVQNGSLSTRYLISVANLVEIKNTHMLINAFYKIHKDFTQWNLMIVGDFNTEYGSYCLELVHKMNMESKIKFTGRVNNVVKYLNMAEIFILPSSSKGEGSPIAILEAMANGKNVLASDVPGIRDQLSNFPDHLFNPDVSKDLVEKLKKFMSIDKEQNKKIGNIFQRYVDEKYSIHKEVDSLQNLYEKMLA